MSSLSPRFRGLARYIHHGVIQHLDELVLLDSEAPCHLGTSSDSTSSVARSISMERYFPEICHLVSTNHPPETSLRTHDIALCPPGAFPGSTPFFRLLLLCPDDLARPETSHRIGHLHRLDQGRNAAIIFLVDEDVTKGATLAFTKLQIELSPPRAPPLPIPIPPLTTKHQHPLLPPSHPPPHSPRPPRDPPDLSELTGPRPREPVPSQSGRRRLGPHPALRRWGPALGPNDGGVDQLVPQRQGRGRGAGGGGERGSAGGGAGRG